MKKRSLIFATTVGLSVAAHAVNIAWDGSNNDVLESPDDTGNNVTSLALPSDTVFSTTAFNSPATTGGVYTATVADGGTSPGDADFYHAISKNTGISSYSIFDGGNADLLARLQVQNNAAGNGTTATMNAWNVTADAGNPTLETIAVNGWASFGAASGSVRFLIQDSSGDWHASGTSDGSSAAASGLAWVAFTPINGDLGTFGAVTTPNLNNLTRVGYYQSLTTAGGGGIFATGFNAAFVPEPSIALLGGLGLLGLLRRRRA